MNENNNDLENMNQTPQQNENTGTDNNPNNTQAPMPEQPYSGVYGQTGPDVRCEWNGAKTRSKRSKKGVFAAVAAVVMAFLIITLSCALLFNGGDGWPFLSGGAQGTTTDNPSGGAQEVNETVSITDSSDKTTYTDLNELYDKCSVSCATIMTTLYNGYSIGSGFVITEDGYIVTNHHVIEDYSSIKVIFYDGSEYDAELVGSDASSDLAVLKIEAEGLVPIELGNSDELKVGDEVVAIGTPYSLSLAGTMTQGIISGVNREVTVSSGSGAGTKTMRLIQTDSSINPGNSGGPLINMQGQVVGINTLKLMDEYEGIGFAIPMTNAVDIINMLIRDGEVVNRPDNDYVSVSAFLNITVSTVNDQIIDYYRLPQDVPQGALILSIGSRDAAIYKAGAEIYDIITEFNGNAITSIQDLQSVLAECKAGDTAEMTIYRISRDGTGGTEIKLSFILDAAE